MEDDAFERIAEGLRQAILHSRGITVPGMMVHEPYKEERERMASMSTKQIRKLWDAYDGTNSPLGICGEAIHFELNKRGDGRYCAV